MKLRSISVERPLEILTSSQVERIHSATLDILERTGVVFEHEKAIDVLHDAGCRIDGKRVRFPPHLVEDCLRRCPSSFSVKTRHPDHDLRFGGRELHFMSWGAMDAVDLETGARITATLDDEVRAVRLLDSLDIIHAHYGAHFRFEDVAPVMAMPIKTAIGIRNSTKLQSAVSGFDWDLWQIKMAQATGQELFGTPVASPPLTWDRAIVDSVFRYTEVGLPIFPTSGQVFGGSAPATLAGALAMNNAELISILVLTQVLNPGNRFAASDYSQPLGMRSGQALLGAIENALAGAAFTQMWRHYGIPCALAANSSDSKLPDYQCATEKAMNAVVQCMAGPNLYLSAGAVYDELTWSPIVLVMDAEVYGMIARVLQGIEVTDDTLALDLIRQVGPIPGHFLDREHTRRWWTKEQFVPQLADRAAHPEWVQAGSKSMIDRARERMEHLLASHEPVPLPEEQSKALDEILVEAESYYRERGVL